MELSLFLAKLFGLYLLVIGILCVVRRQVIAEVVDEALASRPMMLLSGMIALTVGLAMAIGHSVWELNWRGLITLLGYLSLAKGVMRIGFPDIPRKAAGQFVKGTGRLIWIGIVLILGAYLAWVGFTKG